MFQDLNGKVAVVTGATSGIGRATANAFAAAGTKVVVCGKRTVEGEETAHAIIVRGGEAIFVAADISDAGQVERVVGRAVDAYGRLDVAFNNAGTAVLAGRLADETDENFDTVFNTNVRGLWLSMKYEIRQMVRQGQGGAIINCSSVQGHIAIPGSGHYTASKHAVEGYTKLAALDYAADGIRINAVAPAIIEAPLGGDLLEGEAREMFLAMHPLGSFGQPADVADTVLFLASDVSRYVTGTSLRVDGGYLAR